MFNRPPTHGNPDSPGGTSGTVAPTSTTPGVDITDGTTTLRYIGPGIAQAINGNTITSVDVRAAGSVLVSNTAMNALVEGVLSGWVPISQTTITPSISASSDQYQTASGQTVQMSSGPNSKRFYYNSLVAGLPFDLGSTRTIVSSSTSRVRRCPVCSA